MARVLGHADTSMLSRWERGIVIPGVLQVFKLARIYHTLPQILFDDLWNDLDKDESLLALADESFSNNQQMYL